jgi:regulatory protein
MAEKPGDDIITKRLRALKEAKIRAARFCAYQERTQQEVIKKLQESGLDEEEADEVLSELILENFVNEERFARTFAGSKFRLKQWGRRKIQYELKRRGLSEYCIRTGLSEIDDDSYTQTIDKLIKKKVRATRAKNYLDLRSKVVRYLIGKGYEHDLVQARLEATPIEDDPLED